MNGSGQVQRFSLIIVTTVALVFGLLLVGRATPRPANAATTASPAIAPTATKIEGRQVKIRIKGQRLGKKAKIVLKGYAGNATGVKRTVLVKKTKTVKRLKTGKYKVIAKKIRKNGAVAKAKRIKPERVTVTKDCGAKTVITYRMGGRQVLIKVKGRRYGERATVTLKGYQGKATGVKRTVQVKNAKVVKRLKIGKYKVIAKKIRKNGAVAKAKKIKPERVTVTKAWGAKTVITYRQTRKPTTGAISRVSTDASGTQGNDVSCGFTFSPDGKQIAFGSHASNLVPGDTNKRADAFVKTLATGTITLVSTDANGNQGNHNSSGGSFSTDGKQIAFGSLASNLVPGDTNLAYDVFVKTLVTGAITRVSTDANGDQGNRNSSGISFSPDGMQIAFSSHASNLVPGDTNERADAFVKTLATGTITLVSTDANGNQGNHSSSGVSFSPDGKQIAFRSHASNLVPGDTNLADDVFVKTLATGAITRVSTDRNGVQGIRLPLTSPGLGSSSGISFSPDGKQVAFSSRAENLVPGDTNNTNDVFVKTLATGAITRVSTDANGNQGNHNSSGVSFSPDGKQVIFLSGATNLIAGDTNHEPDIFVKTMNTGAITRVSTDRTGGQSEFNCDDGEGCSRSIANPKFSPDGKQAAFSSEATNLVPGDSNNLMDIFVKTIPLSATP